MMPEPYAFAERFSNAPATLIRAKDGRITFWSAAMEQRYGFHAEQAVGCIAHRLLKTTSWQALDRIELELVERQTWSGGLIHCRANGHPVMTANHWYLHNEIDGQEPLVTELHADILPSGTPANDQLADIMTTLAHELSQPLTAIGNYVTATKLAMQPAWIDKIRINEGLSESAIQVGRANELLRRLQALGNDLRDKSDKLRRAQERLTGTRADAERLKLASRKAVEASRAVRAKAAEARMGRQQACDALTASTAAMSYRNGIVVNAEALQHLLRHQGWQQTADGLGEILDRLQQVLESQGYDVTAPPQHDGAPE